MSTRFIPSDISFSLEVFPPKTEEGTKHLMETVDAYLAVEPAAITVTFGATGTKESEAHLRNIIQEIRKHTDVPIAAHMTCGNRSKTRVDAMLENLWNDGVRHIVALRGDLIEQNNYKKHEQRYERTYDFVAAIKRQHPEMSVYVAGYPETHPESPSEHFDIDHLKRKVDAGADGVLTQFFFDPEIFLHWRDKVEKRGIHVPLVPGLLPIMNFSKTCNMASKCNANMPQFLHTMFDDVEAGTLDHHLLAMNVMSHQITRLVEHGVSHFHFYTMNETLLTRHLCKWMRAGF